MKRAFSRKNLWERSPRLFKAVTGRALGLVPLNVLMGRQFRNWQRFVQDSQWWSTDQYHQYQFQRLKRILTIAYERTDFYRRHFKQVSFEPRDFKDISDLSSLPTIDKETVRENLQAMTAVSLADLSVDYTTTSGTGGNPLCFYMDSSRHAVEFAHLAASWKRVGYNLGDTMAVLRGDPIPLAHSGMYYEYDPLLRHHKYSTFHMTGEQMERYVRHMHMVSPKFVHAYPSAAYTLARFMFHESMRFPPSVKAVLLESEPDFAHQRDFIQEHFSVRVFSSYGHTEKLVLATQCEHSSLYHVWPTYGYCEFLDDQSSNVSIGQKGEIVGTGFINEVVPFIRYRTEDYAILAGQSCGKCGRNHLLLDRIRGHRTQEFLVTHDREAIIAWVALNMHDDTFDGIVRFQFTQDTPGYLGQKSTTLGEFAATWKTSSRAP
ncbi:MAG: phenylacetate--CoA ligase family protein [Planctomycetota bacterium]|jgi:phenylacetate-CoA ligase